MQPTSPTKAREAIARRWFLGAPLDAAEGGPTTPRAATTAQSRHRRPSAGGGAAATPATPRAAEESPRRRRPLGVPALQLPRGATVGSGTLKSPGGPTSRSPGRSPGAGRRTPRVDPVWGPSASLCSFGAHFI